MIKLSGDQANASPITNLIDQSLWAMFLVMVAGFSILTQRFDTSLWQLASGAFFVLFTVFFLAHLLLQIRINIAALKSARVVLCLMFAIPVWLFLQTFLPGDAERLFVNSTPRNPPSWWQPTIKLSVTPVKTYWLALSSLFLACWGLFAISILTTRLRVIQLLWVLFIIALTHAILGIVAFKAGVFLVDKAQVDGHFDVARGWFVNRNHYAAFLAMGGSAAIALLMNMVSRMRSMPKLSIVGVLGLVGFCLSALIIVAAILASQSRAGLLAPLMMLGLLIMVGINPKLGVKLRLTIIVVFSLVAGGVLQLFGDQWLSRVSIESFSLGERWLQWKVTLEAIFQAPIFGFGGGSYGAVFQVFRDHNDFRQVIYNQSHNQFLHVWLEQGLVGLLIWASLLSLIVYRIFTSLKTSTDRFSHVVSWACLVVLGASVVQSIVDFNLQIVVILSTFYLYIALTFVAPHLMQGELSAN